MTVEQRLLPETPYRSLDDYVAAGGGSGLEALDRMGPTTAIAEIRASGLRGRGGAGFPTAIKLGGVASAVADRKFVVANVSEGEPGTELPAALEITIESGTIGELVRIYELLPKI